MSHVVGGVSGAIFGGIVRGIFSGDLPDLRSDVR